MEYYLGSSLLIVSVAISGAMVSFLVGRDSDLVEKRVTKITVAVAYVYPHTCNIIFFRPMYRVQLSKWGDLPRRILW